MQVPFILILFMGLALVAAQRPKQDASPPREERAEQSGPGPEDSVKLTDKQKELVRTVLTKYKPASLTAAEARSINDAFREGGLRRGPGLEQAIRDAGFDPRRISELAPPPKPKPRADDAGKNSREERRP